MEILLALPSETREKEKGELNDKTQRKSFLSRQYFTNVSRSDY